MPHPASGVDPALLLRSCRSAVDIVAEELEALGARAPDAAVSAALTAALERPALARLSELPGGPQRLVQQAVEDYRRFRPSPASNAQSAAGLVRILLLQNIDLLWWDAFDDFATDGDIDDSGLLDLVVERKAGHVRFSFGIGSDRLVRRGRDFLVQRLAPRHEPRGPGLACTAVRPAMLGLLNEVADRVAATAPPRTPPIRVNSLVRSVEHQLHLRSLGFSALLPSAHCRGWAADVEVEWMRRFGADGAVRQVLLDYLDAGVLNVIDEGRAWHVCLNPAEAEHYAASVRR